ncbi:MAG: glycosyltransferase [Chlorobiaceae bacterium]|nr:glycosyltransferase [Chlorobiaceae bacterium]
MNNSNHHQLSGWSKVLQSSSLFDSAWYLEVNPDVATAGVDPALHYLAHGFFEHRRPNPTFNADWYLNMYPDVAEAGINPFVHYILHGESEHRSPCPNIEGADSPEKRFRCMNDFLVSSLFITTIEAPYSEDGHYIITYMESCRKLLYNLYKCRDASSLVSIIMPTFNRANCIRDAVESVLAQSYPNWELLIIDDGSQDNTREIIASYEDKRISYSYEANNKGAASARNNVLACASGEFICYLDSDNTLEKDFILIMANELKSNPELDLAYCAQRAFSCEKNLERETFIRFAPFHRPMLENNNYIDIGVIMHRKNLTKKYGGFDPAIQRLEDWELLLRYTEEKNPKSVPAILSNYRYGKAQNQITFSHSTTNGLNRINHYLRRQPVSEKIRKCLIEGIDMMYSRTSIRSTTHMHKVSIVIPSYESEQYLRLCVEAIQAFTADNLFELIIVDNASNQQVVDYLQELSSSGIARVLFNRKNLGFSCAVNQGIELSEPSCDIVILNNDAVVTEGWLEGLLCVLEEYPETGIVVPQQVLLPGHKTTPIHNPFANHKRECDVNISMHHANLLDPLFDPEKGYMELSFAPFFCALIPRKTLNEIGPLDFENGPHYRSDRLYCDHVRHIAKRKIIYTPFSKVYHFVQCSTEVLKSLESKLYNDLCVENNWGKVSENLCPG